MASPYSTGLELVLCSCEDELISVLTDDEQLVCAQVWAAKQHATEVLVPSLENMFRLAGYTTAQLRRIGCVRGPGSFTGIRLVLSTASALRRTCQAQLAALDYLQALATSVAMRRQLLYNRKIWIVTHARRGIVHLEPFISYGPVIPAISSQAVRLTSVDNAKQAILTAAQNEEVFVAGSGLERNPALLENLLSVPTVNYVPLRYPDIDALRLLGRHGDYFAKDVEPKYIRSCDAIDNLPHIAQQMGRDAEEAKKTLEELLQRAPRELFGKE